MKEHVGDIRAARATGLIQGMAKGFDMEGESLKIQDNEQKIKSQENMGFSLLRRHRCYVVVVAT